MTDIAITGAGGRMGQRLIALAVEHELNVVAAIERPGHPAIGQPIGQRGAITITDNLGESRPAVLIDFSAPAATRTTLAQCVTRGIGMVIGTTGLSDSDFATIDRAAQAIPILWAANMSLGVNLLFKIAGEVAKVLGDDYDIEILEAHHRFKKDAPSGTALSLADAILKATGKTRDALSFDRYGEEATRERGQIGMHALRLGDEVGLHTAYFAALGERLELTHKATNRDTFAHGALRAAAWLANKPAGRYAIGDMLGIA